ncbi:hypothetical protein DNI29_18235 [Hymenobacter sediminis]|uniref:hypothetical protein n=1 Tax=Hymenobacter sediminis TaxID=2218621 RepID=UPI000DA673F4|nr:hypothetical protein [Hymenobacter sediminis]RPD45324.1 hypothetical protein DNI29_18235 [Hymenobacter sediminis]
MDPRNTPKQPNPAEPTLPTKGTPDTQSADVDGTNLPRPESAPSETEEDTSSTENETTSDTPTDATASTAASDTGGDTDPGASNTSNDEPL